MKKIAIIGVMNPIGREILSFLADDGFKKQNVVALEPKVKLGTQTGYGEEEDIDVAGLDTFDFSGVAIAVFVASEEVSRRYIPKLLAKGIKVVDTSAYAFGETDVPMVVAGVNDEELARNKKGLVNVPSAVVNQILLPLKFVEAEYGIKRIVVSTYTSTSVRGKEGMDELFSQTRKIFMNESLADNQAVFGKQIAFNVIPQIDEFIGEETKSEWSINAEIKKVLARDVKVHANCAVVPAFIGNAAYVNVECEKEVDVEDVRRLMKKTAGVVLFDKNTNGGYVTLNDVQGEIEVYISRVRQDVSVENGFSFWSVADNLRFGMAGNVFKIIKLWLK